MTLQTRLLTYAEYLKEPEVMARFEIIDGEVIMSASPSFARQVILANLHVLGDLVESMVMAGNGLTVSGIFARV